MLMRTLFFLSLVAIGIDLQNTFGHYQTDDSERTGTELLDDGFTIHDPEGRQVNRFDGVNYWTTTP